MLDDISQARFEFIFIQHHRDADKEH